MVGFDPIVRILHGVVERVRYQLLDHRAQRRCPVGHDLDRIAVSTERGLEDSRDELPYIMGLVRQSFEKQMGSDAGES